MLAVRSQAFDPEAPRSLRWRQSAPVITVKSEPEELDDHDAENIESSESSESGDLDIVERRHRNEAEAEWFQHKHSKIVHKKAAESDLTMVCGCRLSGNFVKPSIVTGAEVTCSKYCRPTHVSLSQR